MKFLIILFSLIIFQTEYPHTAQNKDFMVKYKFEKKADGKTYMLGHITFQKNNKNGINTNMIVEGHRIGTVPQMDGTFELELPDKKGQILVWNSKYIGKWRFDYEVKLSRDKDFTIGDN
ncbi:hypothetical protein [uncultured Marivirga sp.]|uniref:hypothetical protein n=1 Tax=uncultured Marivirga sp. TaxID=1123707 RepID=UPI0030ECFCEB|tara:strand:- start:55791 stop:56147 length:357 start_codon:yes stop_codon:yes gene_type:complete